jgi:hypothetical protein
MFISRLQLFLYWWLSLEKLFGSVESRAKVQLALRTESRDEVIAVPVFASPQIVVEESHPNSSVRDIHQS